MATKYSTAAGDALPNLGEYLETDEQGKSNYVPEGPWKTQREFLDYAIKLYEADTRYDKHNRDWALEDLQFAAGDQWDAPVKAERIKRGRPCLTINVLPQFIGQVVGDRRMNKVTIKVRPFKAGTKEIADIRSGLIKSIELYSRAERAYDASCEDQTACGIGNLRVDMEYAADDVFDQDIRIKHVPNPLAVVWDRMSVDPTGRDAKHCFVDDNLPKEVFEEQYPDVVIPVGSSGLGLTNNSTNRSTSWIEGEMIRVTEFWELIEKPALLALLQNGDVVDISEPEEKAKYSGQFFMDPATGKPKIRKSKRTYARMHLVTSFAILSECYEIPLSRLPIVRVEGRTIRVGEDRVRFGLVRFTKDSQRLKNYWRSKAAEAIALAPQAQWIADAGAVEGREQEFRNNAKSGDPLLIHNKGSNAPERVEPAPIPAALINEATMNQQDIKDTSGLHDASLGIQSNEVSGRAINARKVEGDVATVIYHDNLNQAIMEIGDVTNQMIPICYDAVRTVRIVGDDDKHRLLTINDPANEDSPNICMGKYDVVLDTGPSFTTQRQEAVDGFMAILQTSPELMQVIGDKVVENMDLPGSSEIADRLFKMVPAQLLSPEEQQERAQAAAASQQNTPPDPQAAEQQQMAEAAQHAQLQEAAAQLQHAEQLRQLELAQKQADLATAQANAQIAEAKVREAHANATKAEANSYKTGVEADAAPLKVTAELTHSEDKHNQALQHADDQHIQSTVQGGEAHILDMQQAHETHEQDMSAAQQQQGQDVEAHNIAMMKQNDAILKGRAAEERAENDPNATPTTGTE